MAARSGMQQTRLDGYVQNPYAQDWNHEYQMPHSEYLRMRELQMLQRAQGPATTGTPSTPAQLKQDYDPTLLLL